MIDVLEPSAAEITDIYPELCSIACQKYDHTHKIDLLSRQNLKEKHYVYQPIIKLQNHRFAHIVLGFFWFNYH